MSTRSLKVRLDRLERLAAKIPKEPSRVRSDEFTIDIAIAKALSEDYRRMQILGDPFNAELNRRPNTEAEDEELRILEKRVSAVASEAKLPPDYGRNELYRDRCRLNALALKRNALTDAETIEEDQLEARKIAHLYQSADGRAWRRIEELERPESKRMLTLDEIDELIHLNTLHPPLPADQNSVFSELFGTFEETIAGLKKKREELIKLRERWPGRF